MIESRRFPVIALVILALLYCGIARAALIKLQVDTQKSQIKASVDEPLATLRDTPTADATFQIVSGEVEGDPANVAATGRVNLVIDATTYNSGSDHRDRKILSSALQTGQYPTITFSSTRIENVDVEAPGAMGTATVIGDLTLHGTTRRISVPVSITMSPDGIFSGDGSVTFDYTDYGVKVPRLLFAVPAGREVTITFHVVAERANAAAQPQASR
jgi:polyisoprenoid-binding protein YceI